MRMVWLLVTWFEKVEWTISEWAVGCSSYEARFDQRRHVSVVGYYGGDSLSFVGCYVRRLCVCDVDDSEEWLLSWVLFQSRSRLKLTAEEEGVSLFVRDKFFCLVFPRYATSYYGRDNTRNWHSRRSPVHSVPRSNGEPFVCRVSLH